jgi:hypothetical protein
MGSISKQGSLFLRYLLVEAASSVVRFDPGFVSTMHTAAIRNIVE